MLIHFRVVLFEITKCLIFPRTMLNIKDFHELDTFYLVLINVTVIVFI